MPRSLLKVSEMGFEAKSESRACSDDHDVILCYARLTGLWILGSSLGLNYFVTPLLKESF